MILSKDIVLKSFINRCKEEKQEALYRFLPDKVAKDLHSIKAPVFSSDKSFDLSSVLQHVHYSYFIPTIKSLTKQESKLFLAILQKDTTDKLKKVLSITPSKKKISSHGKEFLHLLLLQSILPKDDALLPKEYLLKTSATPLLDLTKKELIQLIDYLAMYDLAQDCKKLIDKELLERVFSCLSRERKKFVQGLFSHKEPFSSPPLELKDWDGNRTSLLLLLHKRGMNRLAKAISFQHEDFIWYLTHTLDIGRGNFINTLILEKTSHTISGIILSHILELIPMLNPQRDEDI